MTAGQPPTLTILYMYCTGGTDCLSRTPGIYSVCAIRTQLRVNLKIPSIRKEPMLSGLSHSKCWVSTGGSSQRCPGFNSQLLYASLFTFLHFLNSFLIPTLFAYFWHAIPTFFLCIRAEHREAASQITLQPLTSVTHMLAVKCIFDDDMYI